MIVQPGRNPPDKEEGHEAAQEAGCRERLVEADSANGLPLQEEQEEGRALKFGQRSSHQRSDPVKDMMTHRPHHPQAQVGTCSCIMHPWCVSNQCSVKRSSSIASTKQSRGRKIASHCSRRCLFSSFGNRLCRLRHRRLLIGVFCRLYPTGSTISAKSQRLGDDMQTALEKAWMHLQARRSYVCWFVSTARVVQAVLNGCRLDDRLLGSHVCAIVIRCGNMRNKFVRTAT